MITAGIKKCKSISIKKNEKHDLILLLAKTKLNIIEVLIFKDLLESNLNCDEFVSVNNVLQEHNEMKEIKNPKNAVGYTI